MKFKVTFNAVRAFEIIEASSFSVKDGSLFFYKLLRKGFLNRPDAKEISRVFATGVWKEVEGLE